MTTQVPNPVAPNTSFSSDALTQGARRRAQGEDLQTMRSAHTPPLRGPSTVSNVSDPCSSSLEHPAAIIDSKLTPDHLAAANHQSATFETNARGNDTGLTIQRRRLSGISRSDAG
ncbi:hypothetical protein COCMIDRAFT_22683 [Bipolaris oryzae ATCC 44560]|uniref:Uncharacterized protein n=1 Tax=Bipolaris oryzae ATCC 44560 TaxID=930090 RepID=W6ZI94_COCMI|nr:uncharacterized protein COCMIDRAFT_22683 [Bipolaris oryzae ATCC 44560]EUC49700.1 hypothetical protein COCMIDRAFT_22683 [Bipolaris oryzae ATCC 44560]